MTLTPSLGRPSDPGRPRVPRHKASGHVSWTISSHPGPWMRHKTSTGPPGPTSLGQMPIFVYSHGQAVPAASLHRLDHPHDTFPRPSHQDQQRRTDISPAGSTRLEPLTPQNLATSAKVPPGHPVPVLTITPFPTTSWPRSHGPEPDMTPRQALGLQPHPAREQRPPKRLFPP